MGMEGKKVVAVSLILFLAMALYTCRPTAAASVVVRTNSSSRWCEGRAEQCLIGDMDMDEEWLVMDSEISRRMMFNIGKAVTEGTKDPKHQAVPCPPGKAYRGCLPTKNAHTYTHEYCDTYKRAECNN